MFSTDTNARSWAGFTPNSASQYRYRAQHIEPLQPGSTVTLVGKIQTLRVLASGWAIGRVSTDDFGDVNVNGNALSGLTEKQIYEFTAAVEAQNLWNAVEQLLRAFPDYSRETI